MESQVEPDVSRNVFHDESRSKFRSTKSSDSLDYNDQTPRKFCIEISQDYIHEHTDLGPKTSIMTCPNCLMSIETNIRYNETSLTHVAAACLLPLGLCALPYCTPYFRNVEHYCPMCSVYLGTSFAKGGTALKCCRTKTTND